MDKTILISLPLEDLEILITDCVNSCLKYNKQECVAPTETDEFLTIQEAAKFLNLSVATMYSKNSRGELPVMKRTKRLYFSKVELIDYLKQGRKKTLAETASAAEKKK